MNPIKCAVIGVGHLGQFHAEKYAKLVQAELIAVVDMDEKRAQTIAKKYKTQAITDYHDLVGQIQAVSIASPTKLHFDIAKYCLQHGIHVLVEKPITTTVAEANELIHIAEKQCCVLQVGHLERFNSAIIALRDVINTPSFIESHRIAPFTPRGADVNVVLDIMIHDIDIICQMVKSTITQILANGVPLLTDKIDIANVRLQFENGCVANVTASRAGIKTERKMRIFQSDAYLSIDLHNKKYALHRKGNGELFPGIPNFTVDRKSFKQSDAILLEIEAFLHSISEQKPAVVSGEDGRDALAIAHTITDTIREQLKQLNYAE